ncbi:uncharacterized protein LY89DRAFT_680305 [Mollisia scopiformis]|uniref:Uncharacterized protein n=1 Tax=Mollisia scopiformis TaxID=149040 RepID=A0A194XTN6_MOLSC|nr:uncharacterized protein LY89DRAFT_680305 [Mollisia scopiformis]KUJ23573.1 hypothetical protein LY89DRAFT_680305 [Mollisia scopiformis]
MISREFRPRLLSPQSSKTQTKPANYNPTNLSYSSIPFEISNTFSPAPLIECSSYEERHSLLASKLRLIRPTYRH